jgi:hypothetical protein
LNYIANSRPVIALLTDVGDVWVYRDEWERVPALCSQENTEIALGSCMLAPDVRGVFLVILPAPTVARVDGAALQVTRLLPASTSFTALIPNHHDQADVPFALLLGDDRVLYEASYTGRDVVVRRLPLVRPKGSDGQVLFATYDSALIAGDCRVPQEAM